MSTVTSNVVELDKVVIKFAGDSGDGMQLTGTQFTDTSALLGNDIATFPDYPAEIRAPAGTVAGVSGFQVHIGKIKINTPGDQADVLVAMNPAALFANLKVIKKGGTIICDEDSFGKRDFKKAEWDADPFEDGTLDAFQVVKAPITSLTKEALKDMGLDMKTMTRCKNMFCLGMVYWMFSRPTETTESFLKAKFAKKPEIVEANIKAMHAGHAFAETIEMLASSYTILPADLEPGTYRNITGNQATAWGFLAAAQNSGRELFLGTYPITPASDVLHELVKHKNFGTKIFQAEDEIAGVCSAIGAAFAGNLAITTTSGPGLALKGEAVGLAVMTELPMVIVDIQRGGPSTGLPTKTEQSDLNIAVWGRNGECPAIVVAASSPANCFDYAYISAKLALEHMTPVVLLTDGYLGNGAEPWKIKSTTDMPPIKPNFVTPNGSTEYLPYLRDPQTLARFWAIPGMAGYEHRIGGLEKDQSTGNVSYDPENHEIMTKIRQEKVDRVANFIPEQKVIGEQEGDLLVIGWGGTYGHLYTAVDQVLGRGGKVGLAQFNYISPLPKNTEEILSKYKNIVVCELNNGQFVNLLRSKYPQFEYNQFNKIQGLPFLVSELIDEFNKYL